jgi:hypothetical protein
VGLLSTLFKRMIFAAEHFVCAVFEEADWRNSCFGAEKTRFTLSPIENFSSGVIGLCCAAACS